MRAISKILPIAGLVLLFGGCANTPAEKTYSGSTGMASSQSAADAAAAAAARAEANRRAAMAAQPPQTSQAPVGPVADRTVFFGYDQYTLDSRYTDLLARNAAYLAGAPNTPVRVEGHTDERGSVEYNLALGQRRADAVRRALTTLGVREGMIESVSWGEQKPLASGDNEAAWARNRRAEIVYSIK
ncbi:MAG: peptidoglycan-associated lipoprotein Pal [Ideonella sp.]